MASKTSPPADLLRALNANAGVEDAKKPDTRARRVAAAIKMIKETSKKSASAATRERAARSASLK